MYPVIHIHVKKYQHNVKKLTSLLSAYGVSMMAVTKSFLADQMLVDMLNHSDVDMIGDSRIDNLKAMKTDKKKVLLRLPQSREIGEVIRYADISLNSEIETIDRLNDEAIRQHKTHGIILMFDLGDLREGIYYRTPFEQIIRQIMGYSHIVLVGIGTNLTCYGGVIPTLATYQKLIEIKTSVESIIHRPLEIISGGNSSSIAMINDKTLPKEINQLRIGEALILGRETAYGRPIEDLYDDVFTLEAEIIELQTKPSMPEGLLGMDAFGEPVKFEDQGLMRRAILAVGRQDVLPAHVIPPLGVKVLGASSDHLICDINGIDLELGDTVVFKLSYGGVLSLMTSPYVTKVYHDTIQTNMG